MNQYTIETFTMMLETMLLGAEYLGIDIKKEAEKLHAGEGKINYEYAGRGEPSFANEDHLPKLSDLMGLCADSPIDIGGGRDE